MVNLTRPLLAASLEDVNTIQFPILATQKLDGIRCMKVDGKVLTRKFKELPNVFIREFLERTLPDGIDGEIMLNSVAPEIKKGKNLLSLIEDDAPPREVTFNDIQSEVMSFDGEPDFKFCAFDYVKDNQDKPYFERVQDLKKYYDDLMLKYIGLSIKSESARKDQLDRRIKILMPVELLTIDDVNGYEAACLAQGYEGIMLRNPLGRYKCGRSTLKEFILVKVKRFKDSEAKVIGFQEKMHNDNPKETNELGLSKRSSKKEGLVPAGTLGALLVHDIKTGQEFGIGTGLNDAQKKEIWDNQGSYLGKLVTYKYQEVGQKDLPRFPVFKGFRDERDL